MSDALELVVRAIAIGVGATAVMDLWSLFLRRAFGIASLDYALLGRWIGHFPRGRFAHPSIGRADPVPGETVMGWGAHYAIGVVFSAMLIALWGLDWARHPTPLPALAVGVVTILVPFFVMQPAFGLGVAASKTPNPGLARLRSLMTHVSFGVGLYVAALLCAMVSPT